MTVVTATITAAFVESALRRIDGTTTNVLAATLDRIGVRLDAIEAGLKDIGAQHRDGPL